MNHVHEHHRAHDSNGRRFRVVTVGRRGRPEVQTGMVTWDVAIDKLRALGPGYRIADVRTTTCRRSQRRVLVGLICTSCGAVATRKAHG